MGDFFVLPTTSIVIAIIGSWTQGFFLPFLGPTLAIAGIFIAAVIVKRMTGIFTNIAGKKSYHKK